MESPARTDLLRPPLPHENLELVHGWGLSTDAAAFVFRPSTEEGIRRAFQTARETGRSIGLRGAGRSYGDASLNTENIILDLTRFARILSWDPVEGVLTAEAGTTLKQIWEYILPDGWWPPVVSGTMFPTLGGAAGMNIHGKNNFKVGPIGDHILSFDMMLPSGEIVTATPESNDELFYSAIGGFGMLGCFLRFTIRMKKVYSGYLEIEPINVESLDEMIEIFVREIPRSDYLVGWIDAFATGKNLGRGQIHKANYLGAGDDPNPAQTLRLENQELPDTILGILPKSILYKFMRPFMNNVGTRFINLAKFRASALLDRGKTFRQSHAAFAFLLDYVPNWKRSYGPGGLIQYQSFVPEANAARVFKAQLALAREQRLPPYLAVFKRHRKDRFLMSHAVDGYSLALDFRVTRKNRAAVWDLAHRFDEMVLEGEGRFYFAKDSTLEPPTVRRYLGEETVEKFLALKRKYDPEELLQTNLYRRLFPDHANRSGE